MTNPGSVADQDLLRAAICAAGRRLGARGLIAAAEGNLSIRLGDGSLLTTPTGRRKDEIQNDDLAVVPLRPEAGPPARGPRPSSDIAIHRAIYLARPDVLAIAHAHIPASMALTLAGEVPDPAALPETAYHLPRIPYVPFGAMGSEELAGRVAAALASRPLPLPGLVLLERHGAVAVGGGSSGSFVVGQGPDSGVVGQGPDSGVVGSVELRAALTQAVDRLELFDVLCRVWRDAVLLRAATGQTGPIGPAGG